VRVEKDYTFGSPGGARSLVDLFEGLPQLIVYHFMHGSPDPEPCVGCCSLTDNVPNLAHLHARGVTYAVVSRHEVAEQQRLRERFGWRVPFYANDDFNRDCGAGGGFGLSVFLRDGDDVFRSYFTKGRGVDRLRMDFSLLDLTPWGRQEVWEDSPEGWPQSPTMAWLRRSDEYAPAPE
jgi:predicted dithiol-disulfide oxidoreductase (DUF899 family)